ncbi:hypothetical protein SAMN05446037_1006139 [Anaerovirgula multivorans]|uniref:Uncharacterized protein n=1 Tax=Anaerovirgula multivorans TaxID=312168 RepID=A0A239CT76_9FIRM|nr:hypothetical protein [Anaerovirgula multivorans]SNS23307.1 hypothetical protein SAMN05446037_1006139 [Anaerovirgula multivorans]
MLNERVRLFGRTNLVDYLHIDVAEVLYRYLTYGRIERLYLEGGGDAKREQIVKVIEDHFDCAGEMYI